MATNPTQKKIDDDVYRMTRRLAPRDARSLAGGAGAKVISAFNPRMPSKSMMRQLQAKEYAYDKKMAPQRKKEMEALDREIASRNPSRQYRGQNPGLTGKAVQDAAKRSNDQYRVRREAEEAKAQKDRIANEPRRQAYLKAKERQSRNEARSFIANEEARAQLESAERREARKRLPARQRYSKDFVEMAEGYGEAKKMFDEFMAKRKPVAQTSGSARTDGRNTQRVGKITIGGQSFDSAAEARAAAKQIARENRTRRAALAAAQELGIDTKGKDSAFAGFDVSAGGTITDAQRDALAKGMQKRLDSFVASVRGAKGGNYSTYQAEQQKRVQEARKGLETPGSGGDAIAPAPGRYTPHMTTLERDARRRESARAAASRDYQSRMAAEQQRLNYANSGRGSYDRSVAHMQDALYQAQAEQNRQVTRGIKNLLRRSQQLGINLNFQGE